MRVSDFHFDLPEELIAQHPPAERGASRMLVLSREQGTGDREQGTNGGEQGIGDRGQAGGARFIDAMFRDLPDYLRAGDLLVLNDSRVLPARLFGGGAGVGTQAGSQRPSGMVEVLLVEEDREQGSGNREEEGQGAGNREQGLVWRVLVKPAKKVRVGERLEFRGAGGEVVLTAEVEAAGEFGERTLRFRPVEDFYGVVERIGHMPLPPYIRREQVREMDSAEDRERYQTVFSHKAGAQAPGSVAAPTAGLHFTEEMLTALEARGVEIAYVTLHVGLGTFQPVRVDRVEEIRLHSERYTLPARTADALNRALAERRRVVAVGTTTTRTLEHIAAAGRFEAHSGSTSMFIGPGHRFRVVGGLLTNFHLPESTLLMLVSAFAGPPQGGAERDRAERGRERVLGAYGHAVRERYRFYSYGDCMLVV